MPVVRHPANRSGRRRFRRSPYRGLVIAVVLLVFVLVRMWRGELPGPTPSAPLAEGTYAVVRVVDGDTIIVAPKTRVRLIGIDTPETVKPDHPIEPFGPEATAFTKEFLAGGTVRLTFDRERVDRFGRFLAYVWVDDQMLNEELLRAGLARWMPQYHYSADMKRRFRQAEQEAKEAGLGIWSRAVNTVPHRGARLRNRFGRSGPDFDRDRVYWPVAVASAQPLDGRKVHG